MREIEDGLGPICCGKERDELKSKAVNLLRVKLLLLPIKRNQLSLFGDLTGIPHGDFLCEVFQACLGGVRPGLAGEIIVFRIKSNYFFWLMLACPLWPFFCSLD